MVERDGLRPAVLIDVPNATAAHRDPFGDEQGPLEMLAPTVPANLPARCDDAMVGHAGNTGAPHDVADGTPRTGTAGQSRDFAVGHDASDRDAPHDREDAARKRRVSARG